MYAKLQNGFLRSAPKTIVLDGRTINNPYDSELEQLEDCAEEMNVSVSTVKRLSRRVNDKIERVV